MKANYGYADGSGEYFITIDTDVCDGCGECARVCPSSLFEVAPDDYDQVVARVKEKLTRSVGVLCPGYERCRDKVPDCHAVCRVGAISHSW
ncbi:MAG: 4Fe-4S binding protein [Chloroflexi bacterium]|nr:4Fe-4S binding protein [Chloroflexota bacterium]